jgi:hypothetical protein
MWAYDPRASEEVADPTLVVDEPVTDDLAACEHTHDQPRVDYSPPTKI